MLTGELHEACSSVDKKWRQLVLRLVAALKSDHDSFGQHEAAKVIVRKAKKWVPEMQVITLKCNCMTGSCVKSKLADRQRQHVCVNELNTAHVFNRADGAGGRTAITRPCAHTRTRPAVSQASSIVYDNAYSTSTSRERVYTSKMISKTIREPPGAVKKRFPRNMKPFFKFRLGSYLKKVNFSKAPRLSFCVI